MEARWRIEIMNNISIPATHNNKEYDDLLMGIGNILEEGRRNTALVVNNVIVQTYWQVGRCIVKYEQKGNAKAEYGSELLKSLGKDLSMKYGKGFSWSNIYRMRQFYIEYPIFATVSQKLSWSHYVELLKIADPLERSFYEKESEIEHWGIRELKRQKESMLFHRLALSTDKNKVMELAKEGQIIEKAEDILKDPYIFEFTGLPELPVYNEGDLEEVLITNLSQFLLELGKGFTYMGRQQKFTIEGRTYAVDLVFYHRILKCFVLIDLKRGTIQHEDVGQMNFYLNYYREEMNTTGDTEPIGIILGAYNNKLTMKYALQNIDNQIFASRYQLYFPNREQLETELLRFTQNVNEKDPD